MSSRRSESSVKPDDEKASFTEGPSYVSQRKISKTAEETIVDENYDYLQDFDLDEAWQLLRDIQGCMQVTLNLQQQKDMGVEVGLNVSSEFPWKQVKYKVVREYLPDESGESLAEEPMEEKFAGMKPNDYVLVGYAAPFSEDEDVFLIYTSVESTKRASDIIKTIETYQRWLLNQATTKKGSRWVSLGSEAEVELLLEPERKNIIDVEIQSVYPIKHSEAMFQHRFSGEVRDGYVELVPGDKKFDNIYRRRIDASVQIAPSKRDLEQQTDPTFPSNAWSQYLYEIGPDDEGLDHSEDEEDEETKKKKQKPKAPSRPGSAGQQAKEPEPEFIKPPPEMSENVKALLEVLDFNQIDMYRDDYALLSSEPVPKYSIPFLKEILCFANISRSLHRYVCGIDWYPTLSGLLVTSYTFTTMATSEPGDSKVDVVKRAVLEPNPVLMWSFDDSLHHKLELEAPREVTYLSFCPYDENVLIGGTMNGQIIIWDLQNRIANGETEEVLNAAQIRYRTIMRQYLAWTKPQSETPIVVPAAVSSLAFSHGGPVTIIRWLSQKHYITVTGQARESEDGKYRFLATCSMGGTIYFWNLDAPLDKKHLAASANRNVPKQLIQDVSQYKKFDRILRPQYIIEHTEPLTSILFNRGRFEYSSNERSQDIDKLAEHVTIQVKAIEHRKFQQEMICSTMIGRLQKFIWEGFDFVQSTEVNKEIVQSAHDFAPVHDGPVYEIRTNPFCDQIFASIGKHVLAIWKEGCMWTPIFWRKRPASLTRLEWSLDRPAMLFLCRTDGTFEAWDLIARTDDASLVDMLGGSILTALTEHCPIMSKKIIGIGDYNSSLRVLILPQAFQSKLPGEQKILMNLINREEYRKNQIHTWETTWLEKNRDLLQAKIMMEEQARLDFERLQKEAQVLEAIRLKKEEEENLKTEMKQKKKLVFDLPERLEKKWDDMNFRRLVNVLMSRRLVDHAKLAQKTAMEKERLKYEKAKQEAIKKSFTTINDDVAAVRARLLPVVIENKERIEMVAESGHNIVRNAENYEEIEAESDKRIASHPVSGDVGYREFLDRGRQRRMLINKSLGGTTERRHLYKFFKENGELDQFHFGYDAFISADAGKERVKEKYPIHDIEMTTTDAESSPMEGDDDDDVELV